MKEFYIRILILTCIISGLLYQAYGTNETSFIYSLFFITGILVFYFLIPITKKKFIYFVCIFILLHVFLFLVDYSVAIFIYLLCFYFLTEWSKYLRERTLFFILLFLSLLEIFLGIIYFSYPMFAWISVIILISYMIISWNEVRTAYMELKEIYESLLTDYRIHKRQSFHNEQTGRLEERNMIAREMHDSVGHKLTALLMQTEQYCLSEKHENYYTIKQLAAECLEETRKAVRLLQSDEVSGIASVISLIKKLESESNILVHFTTKQGVLQLPISNKQSAILYRSIQEGITNAMKYSSSKEVFITLGVSAIGYLTFEMRNNYSHKHPIHDGFGLSNMLQRVAEVGGKLEIYQTEGQFILQGNIPVGREQDD
ncbi:sensor histidine kinase [Bacillus sp. B1-b2]|uniref:sensor histidine kinase n=1 Tax=Bacillus sp. B1-b2 TaxID=2653201 RepID=UPI00126208C7|nr:histidine kinase [Bacillus sp. B1-b2]KAB7665395.1 histidine kinase [Bacillus sp. B1-b2]